MHDLKMTIAKRLTDILVETMDSCYKIRNWLVMKLKHTIA